MNWFEPWSLLISNFRSVCLLERETENRLKPPFEVASSMLKRSFKILLNFKILQSGKMHFLCLQSSLEYITETKHDRDVYYYFDKDSQSLIFLRMEISQRRLYHNNWRGISLAPTTHLTTVRLNVYSQTCRLHFCHFSIVLYVDTNNI